MAKSLFKAVVLVAIFSVITRVLGFLFRIYLSRELGAVLLGVYHIASSVFMVLVLLVSSGIPLTISKQTARCFVQKNQKSAHSYVSSGLIFGIVLSLVIIAVFVIFRLPISKLFTESSCMDVLLLLLPAVLFSAVYSSLKGYLWGRQDYFSMGLSELIEQVVRIVSFFVLAHFISFLSGAKIAAISLTIACFASMLFIIVAYRKKGGKLGSFKGHFKQIVSSSMPITGVRAASSLIQPLIAIIFPFMLVLSGVDKVTSVSIYGIVMGMTFPLLFLPSTLIGSLSFALIPELAKAQEEKNRSLTEERIKSGILFAVLISGVIIPVYMGLGIPICVFLFDNALSGEFLRWASVIMLPMGLSNISSSILNSLNLEVKSFVNNIIGGVVLILCVVCFSCVLGAYSLILGFFLCMSIISFLNLIKIKKEVKIKFKILKPLLLICAFSIPSSMLMLYVYNLLYLCLPSFVCLLISAFLGVVCFALLLVMFKVCSFEFVFSKVKNVIKISKKRA